MDNNYAKIQNYVNSVDGVLAHLVPVLITDIDECSLSLDNCSPLQECVDTPGSFVCNCLAGYIRLGQDEPCIGELSIAAKQCKTS